MMYNSRTSVAVSRNESQGPLAVQQPDEREMTNIHGCIMYGQLIKHRRAQEGAAKLDGAG